MGPSSAVLQQLVLNGGVVLQMTNLSRVQHTLNCAPSWQRQPACLPVCLPAIGLAMEAVPKAGAAGAPGPQALRPCCKAPTRPVHSVLCPPGCAGCSWGWWSLRRRAASPLRANGWISAPAGRSRTERTRAGGAPPLPGLLACAVAPEQVHMQQTARCQVHPNSRGRIIPKIGPLPCFPSDAASRHRAARRRNESSPASLS